MGSNMSSDIHRRGRGRWGLCLLLLICAQYCAYLFVFRCGPPSPAPGTAASDAPPRLPWGAARDDVYALARGQSFGFFYDVTEDHWNVLRDIYRSHANHLDPERPLVYNPHNEDRRGVETWGDPEIFSSYKAWYQSNYEPNFSCQFEKRVGKNMNGDGPKWVCDPHRIKKLAADRKAKDPSSPGCVVYSIGEKADRAVDLYLPNFPTRYGEVHQLMRTNHLLSKKLNALFTPAPEGSSGSFIFEMGMQKELGEGVCEYHIFDFGDFGGKVPRELKRAHYHRWGLRKQDPRAPDPVAGKTHYGLRDTVKLLGHERLEVIDVFKIDCERCEWETYADWLADDVPLLHQIQVEVHGAPGKTAVDFFDSLERAGYLRFHKEPNIQYNPGCIEYAFVRVETSFQEGKAV